MKKTIAIALTAYAFGSGLAATQKPVYQAKHGGWTVQCSQDLMSDRRSCSALIRTTGRGVIGDSTMSIIIFSADRTKAPTIAVHVPLLILQRGLTLRIDSEAPFDQQCTTVSGDQCLIQGPDRDRLLAAWRNARQLVIRAYGMETRSYDFVFDLTSSADALDDFNSMANKLL
jgi:invasion protein IalB